MFRIYYLLPLLLIILAFTTCQTARNAESTEIFQTEPVAIHPSSEIPLPITDFKIMLKAPELEKTLSPRKNISEVFTAREKADIKVPDPKLMADENSMIIDLALIQKEEYAFPLPGAKVISPYKGRRKNHAGVDLKTFANDTIVAAFDGIVRMSKPYAAYGNVIVIRHFNGMETVYSHNSKNLAKAGQHVKAGQPIALTGRTGRATTEHLHFEVRVNGHHFNPEIVFDLEKRELNNKCLVFSKKENGIDVKAVNILPHQREENYTYIPRS